MQIGIWINRRGPGAITIAVVGNRVRRVLRPFCIQGHVCCAHCKRGGCGVGGSTAIRSRVPACKREAGFRQVAGVGGNRNGGVRPVGICVGRHGSGRVSVAVVGHSVASVLRPFCIQGYVCCAHCKRGGRGVRCSRAVRSRIPSCKSKPCFHQVTDVADHRNGCSLQVRINVRWCAAARAAIAVVCDGVSGVLRPLRVERHVCGTHCERGGCGVRCSTAVSRRVPACKGEAGLGQVAGVGLYRYARALLVGIGVCGHIAAGAAVSAVGHGVCRVLRPFCVQGHVGSANVECFCAGIRCSAAVRRRVPSCEGKAGSCKVPDVGQHRYICALHVCIGVCWNRPACISIAVIGDGVRRVLGPFRIEGHVRCADAKSLTARIRCPAAVRRRVPSCEGKAGSCKVSGVGQHRHICALHVCIGVCRNRPACISIAAIGNGVRRVLGPFRIEDGVGRSHGESLAAGIRCPTAVGRRVPSRKGVACPHKRPDICLYRHGSALLVIISVHGNGSAGIPIAVIGYGRGFTRNDKFRGH